MARRKTRQTSSKSDVPKLPVVKPLRVRLRRQPTLIEKIADSLTGYFGTIAFLLLNFLFFAGWIFWNLHPALIPFDPQPFGMLTMIVSLEAIMLSVVVLISQNRANKIADARGKMDFEIDVASEKQTAAIMQSLDLILHHMSINHVDDMQGMREVNVDKLERRVINEIDTD